MSCPYADRDRPAPCHFELHPQKAGSFFCCVCQQSIAPPEDKPADKPKLPIALMLLMLLIASVGAIVTQPKEVAPESDRIDVGPYR
jgi:hypothetical protein